MISKKIIYNDDSSRIKTKDLHNIFKWHGIIKSSKQQMILRKIIYNHESSRIKTKDLHNIFK